MEVLGAIFFVLVVIWEVIKWVWNHTLGWILSKLLLLVIVYPKTTLFLFLYLFYLYFRRRWIALQYGELAEKIQHDLLEANEKIEKLESEISDLENRLSEFEGSSESGLD